MADKDCAAVMSILAPLFEHIITVPIQSPRAIAPRELAALAEPYCDDVSFAKNAPEALENALSALQPNEALVVAGSLYLASELRPQLMRFKGKSEI